MFAFIGLDVVFMILLNLVFFKAYITVVLRIEDIQKLITENFAGVAQQVGQEEVMTHLMKNQDVMMGYYREILLWIGIFIAVGFIVWVLTQSVSWFIAHKINNSRMNFKKFFGLFSLVSFAGFIIFAGFFFLTTKLINYTAQMQMPIISIKTIAFFPLVVGLILMYVMLLAYSTIALKEPFQKLFSAVVENFFQTAPLFVLNLLILIFIQVVLFWIAQFDPLLTLVAAFFILLPYMAFLRVYFCNVVKELF